VGLAGLAIALAGGAACAYGYLNERERFYPAYLTACFFWLGMSLGSMGLAMLHGLTGGAWGLAIRRIIEAGYETLPLTALLFAPLYANVPDIYEWAKTGAIEHNEALARKAAYLNVDGLHTRALVCLGVWIAIIALLNASSPNDQPTGDTRRARRLQRTSGLGFIAYGLTLTVAAVDWVMSLEPEWYSTMYGVLYLAGQAVSGMSAALVAIFVLRRFAPWSLLVTAGRLNDLGNLLLAFVMFWAYVAFFQYLIIWSGNLPEENVWYLHRSVGGWQYLAAGLMALHFAAPFLLLLSRRMKRHGANLARIAVLLLVMRYVDLYWLIVPGFPHEESGPRGPMIHWLDLAAWAAIGGVWLAIFAWRLAARARLPIYDADLREAVDGRSGLATNA
jgi:hypothetical protein